MSMLAILAGGAFSAGTAMGTASILSVGPNNIMLIREGLIRGRVGLVALTVWGSYIVLLASALVLTGTIATEGKSIRPILSWLGLIALCWFAYSSLRAYYRSSSAFHVSAKKREPASACLRRVLTIIWLNPLTYVELLLMPATIGGTFIMPICRVLFMSGLIMMATVACFGYSFGGGLCAPLFRRQDVLRKFDLVSGILLSFLACIMLTALVLTGHSSHAKNMTSRGTHHPELPDQRYTSNGTPAAGQGLAP
jgi:L-lysine exporter family protein LysE/ArgO